jgi:isopentenyl phosphate kinase
MTDRVFLKLGGALVTEKSGREALRFEVLARLAGEIAAWPGTRAGRLVLAHGSGSFGHVAAQETGFLAHPGDPLAFAQVAAAARRLNVAIVDALIAAGLPAVGVPGGLIARCEDGRVTAIRADVLTDLLGIGLLPVLYGDAAPDASRGGAIASTEPLLAALAEPLGAILIVLATDVDGVFTADPHGTTSADLRGTTPAERLDVITPADAERIAGHLGGARGGAPDVTGGMASKVASMLALVARRPGLEVRIVSGLRPGAVAAALAGDGGAGGTVIRG